MALHHTNDQTISLVETIDHHENNKDITEPKETVVDNVHDMWELPFVHAFLKLFSEVTNFKMPYIEEFEKHLMDSSSEYLNPLIIKMLSFCSSSSVNKQNWEVMLNRLLKRHELLYWDYSPLEDTSFDNLSTKDKVKIYKCICDWLIYESPSFFELVAKPIDGVWRLFPLGKDRNDNLYWHFNDLRLYKEEFDEKSLSAIQQKPLKTQKNKKSESKRKKKTEEEEIEDNSPPEWISQPPKWSLFCKTIDEWELFLDTLQSSRNPDEKKLYKEISETILPKIKQKAINRERKARREELLIAPPIKRSIRLQAKEIQKREEEKRKDEQLQYDQEDSNGIELMNGEVVNIKDERKKRLLARQEKMEYIKFLKTETDGEEGDTVIRIPKNMLSDLKESIESNANEEVLPKRQSLKNQDYFDDYEESDDEEYYDDDDDDDFEIEGKKKGSTKKRKWFEEDIEDEEYIKKRHDEQKLDRERRMRLREERQALKWNGYDTYESMEEVKGDGENQDSIEIDSSAATNSNPQNKNNPAKLSDSDVEMQENMEDEKNKKIASTETTDANENITKESVNEVKLNALEEL